MSYTKNKAEMEFDILDKTVKDAVISPFRKEILALIEAFGESGQSGGSAPYTARAISKAVEKLCLQEPICDITGIDDEWSDIKDYSNDRKPYYQNKRLSSLFKEEGGKPYYIDAIIWQGEEDWDTFTGRVYVDNINFQLIGSSQTVKLPFKPKSYYVNVIRIPITKEEAEIRNLHYIEGNGECYYSVLKDSKQLDEVFEYYEKPKWFKERERKLKRILKDEN